MLHTNALIVWLLLGFFGATYFLLPEEAEREIYSPMLAYLQLAILVVGTLGAVVTYASPLPGILLAGREFLEQPLWVKFGIVVAALIFLFNVSHDAARRAARPRSPTCCCSASGACRSSSSSPSINPANLGARQACTGGSSSTSGSRASGS